MTAGTKLMQRRGGRYQDGLVSIGFGVGDGSNGRFQGDAGVEDAKAEDK